MKKPLIAAAAVAGTAGAALAAVNLRRRYNRWGATNEEVERPIPGDEIIPEPEFQSTRAITIDAPPQYVWPWLVQMGEGRGGAYTYDWIENLLGLDMHSADTIVPEWQHMEVGDRFPMGKDGSYMEVRALEPERTLLFFHSDGNWTWCFTLEPAGEDKTRFISRNRITMKDAPLGQRASMIVIDPGAFIMERKMLLGIKGRAEKLYAERGLEQASSVA